MKGYGDWVRICPLTEKDIEEGNVEIKNGKIHQAKTIEMLNQLSGKVVRLLDISYGSVGVGKKLYNISRGGVVKISPNAVEDINAIEAHLALSPKDVQVGDILEGTALSNIFYNITNEDMKKSVVWNTGGGSIYLILLDHTKFPRAYSSQTIIGNTYGDLGAAYNVFNVIGHTELIKLKVHCDYVKPRYDGKKYACFGSLGCFIDNFSVTLGELATTLGYCPVAKLLETENIEEFERAVNLHTSLRIKIIR